MEALEQFFSPPPPPSAPSIFTAEQHKSLQDMIVGYDRGMSLSPAPVEVVEAQRFLNNSHVYSGAIPWEDYFHRANLTQSYVNTCNRRGFEANIKALDKTLRETRELQQHFDKKARRYASLAKELEAIYWHMHNWLGYYIKWFEEVDPNWGPPVYGSDLVPNEYTGVPFPVSIPLADLVWTVGNRVALALVTSQKRMMHLGVVQSRMEIVQANQKVLERARDRSRDLANRYTAAGDSLEKTIKTLRDRFNAKCQKRCKPPAKPVKPKKPPVFRVWVTPGPSGEATRKADIRRDPGRD
jgi:hypothetical protein